MAAKSKARKQFEKLLGDLFAVPKERIDEAEASRPKRVSPKRKKS